MSNAQRGVFTVLVILAAFRTANAQERPAAASMPPFLTCLGGTAGDLQPLATRFTERLPRFRSLSVAATSSSSLWFDDLDPPNEPIKFPAYLRKTYVPGHTAFLCGATPPPPSLVVAVLVWARRPVAIPLLTVSAERHVARPWRHTGHSSARGTPLRKSE
jgi:hypothetical protein